MITKIQTSENVKGFAKQLVSEGLNFHPDDDFKDYITLNEGIPFYSTKDAEYNNHNIIDYFKVFERCFIEANRFSFLRKDKKKIISIYNNLLMSYKILQKGNETDEDKIYILDNILIATTFFNVIENSKKHESLMELFHQLRLILNEPKDYYVLAITIKEFLLPTIITIEKFSITESTDFLCLYGKAVLDLKKENGLTTLIRDWDNYTKAESFKSERAFKDELFNLLKGNLSSAISVYSESDSANNLDIILSAIGQKYEKRAGQKRKQRAGKNLESAAEFIFNYFNIKTCEPPDFFTSGLEYDHWIKIKAGWFIGVSFEKVHSERWAGTYTDDIGLLDRHKIKYLIHVINNDLNQSDSKVTEIGSYRHLFFMADNSQVLAKLSNNVAMEKYVFPMSKLISKIKELTDNSS
ncbi:MAG: hypothetical protein WCP85_29420 [Mariniphaga sp.]